MFGYKKAERGWKTLFNNKLHNLYASPNIKVIKSKRMKLAGHVARLVMIIIIYYLFLFRSARSIGLRKCLAIQGSCFSFLDPLDIW
jgi:hypothetical protein